MTNWTPFPRLSGCPVPPDTVVRVRFRNGQESQHAMPAAKWRWVKYPDQRQPCDFDVVAYLRV